MKYNNTVVVFDLDGTLYDTSTLDEQNIFASIVSISEYLSIPIEEASIFLNDKRNIPNSEEKQSISKVLDSLFIPKIIVERNQNKYINPEAFIEKDEQLVILMKQLRSKYKIAILTNNRSSITSRILFCLGFTFEDFDLVVTGDELNESKPSVAELQKCVKELNGSFIHSIMIGDRWNVDIQPAIELGMRTLFVKRKNDVIEWIKSELKNKA